MHSEQPESEFARILAGIQERTGLSHQRIADAAGVDRSQVWRWVRAGSTPGYEPVRKLAAWLIAERPEVAAAARQLLPAAGYGTPPAPGPGSRRPSGGPEFPPELEADMAPHLAEIRARIEVASLEAPAERLTGKMVFPRAPADQDSWDKLRALGYSVENVAKMIAVLRADDDETARGRQGGGIAAGLIRA